MKISFKIFFACVLALAVVQCEVVSENNLQNPNDPSPDNVSADFLLNNIEVTTGSFFHTVQQEPGELTRMYQFAGRSYPSAYQGQFFDDEWRLAYSSILEDAKSLIPLANKNKLYSHAGIARVLKAYVLVALVDKYGKVPLSEALDESNFNPKVDSGQDVYNTALAEIDSAVAAFKKDELALPENDLFYGNAGNRDAAWITFANTLKLKILYQERLVADNGAKINTLLNGDIIDEPGEEFIYRYSATSQNPDSRDPYFANNYSGTGTNLGVYMSNYYMNLMVNDKSVTDPRIRYYFYRQVNAPTTDVNLQQCINNPPPAHYEGNTGSGKNGNDPYCEDWNDVGYWGRDHGNNLGIPADTKLRTAYGLYPAGGRFDADQASGVANDQGLQGAGIEPIWMPFYTKFVEAEMRLASAKVSGDPLAALEEGIRGSISYVKSFGTGNNPTGADAVGSDGASFIPDESATDTYISDVETRYNNAAGTQAKLNVIAKEFYLALFGDGLDAYNLYRRIAPEKDAKNWDLQPNISPSPGAFYRSLTYPAAFTQRNSNVEVKPGDGVKVFWDNNSDGFADF